MKGTANHWKIQCIYKKNVFKLYSPRKTSIEPATNENTDTEIFASLSRKSRGYVTSKFRTDEINELFYRKHHLWVEILNKSFEDTIEMKKGQAIGFFVAESENLKFQHVPSKAKAKNKTKSTQKETDTRFPKLLWFFLCWKRIVNQAAKVAPAVIKGTTKEIDNNAQQRINQIISQGGKEIERVLPNAISIT